MNEKIQYVKNEMNSYLYHKKSLERVKFELMEVCSKLYEVGAIDYTKAKAQNNGTYNEQFKLQLLDDEEKLDRRKLQLEVSIDLVDTILDYIESPYKEILVAIYITKNSTYERCSMMEGVNYSAVQLKRIINSEIKTCIKDLKLL